MKKAQSVASELIPVELPKIVYWVDGDQVRKLTNLTVVQECGKSGSCLQFLGEETIQDGKLKHVNVIKCSAEDCYSQLSTALEALAATNLQRERKRFESQFQPYGKSVGEKVRMLTQHSSTVFQVMSDDLLLPEGVTQDSLKVSHYQMAVRSCYALIVKAIVNLKYPNIEDASDEDEDN